MSGDVSISHLLHKCALAYRDNLLNRYVLFVPRALKPSDTEEPLETFYGAANFQHLCGYDYAHKGMKAKDFFSAALSDDLSDRLLTPKYTKNTRAKLRALPTLMQIDSKAAYLVRHPILPGKTHADAICANTNAMIGYIDTGALMVPNTVLELMPMHERRQNVTFVVKTEPNQREYTLVTKNTVPTDPHRAAERRASIHRSLKRYQKQHGSLGLKAVVEQLDC